MKWIKAKTGEKTTIAMPCTQLYTGRVYLFFCLHSYFGHFFLFNTFLYNISQATRVHLAALKHTGYLIVDNSIQFTPIQFIKIITMVQHALCGQFFGQKTKRHVLVCLCKWTNGHLYSTITTYDRNSPNMKEMLFSFHFSSQKHTRTLTKKGSIAFATVIITIIINGVMRVAT